MAEKLTPQQNLAVKDRGGKLLVSAAAGSGKTKVLVDRLMGYLTDPIRPSNLDDFLIITYTKAAAAELRGKIEAKLTERIAEDPGNRHLQHQIQRLYLTKISTVHSFCTDILREYAYRLDISGDFRVADESECQEMQVHVLEQLLDSAYASVHEDSDFRTFVDSQGLGRDDRQIPEIILKVYNSARCHLDPGAWLDGCIAATDMQGTENAADTVWGKYLIDDLHSSLDLHMNALQRCIEKTKQAEGMEKPAALLYQTVDQLSKLRKSNDWDEIRNNSNIDYGRLTFPRKCSDPVLAEQIKAIRAACKKALEKKLRKFSDENSQVLSDIESSAAAVRGLVSLVKNFDLAYDKVKRSRRVLDFGDLEHKALDLLIGRKRFGPTTVAAEICQKFREVMVDEYQDSNAVQDAIFSALTYQRQNCFMVGDVKQSIYQFRLADPGIFIDKYNTYVSAEAAKPGQGRKVLLSSNFRSCGAVISAVNDVFSTCMSPSVGGLYYGEEEKLKEGIPHMALSEPEIELYGVLVREDTYAEEASFAAERICSLLDGNHMVRDGDAIRPITADDIVILLRSPGSVGSEFQFALEQRGVRCTADSGSDIMQTEEISTLCALLRIIRNPLQDIPLITVLASRIFVFSANELAELRSNMRSGSLYAALQVYHNPKAKSFMDIFSALRRESRMCNLSQLLERIFTMTRIDSIYGAMPDGASKVENLQTFCQLAADYESCRQSDLGQFLEHIDALSERGIPSAGAGSSSGAVTIMSIHKSKGLEYPVVFLCGLSREFNREDTRAQVLCDKELGLGLSCVDEKNRVRYPTIAKRAIAAKMLAQSISEEMRVLYVAMTRAKDRLIMTYAARNLEAELADLVLRMDMSDRQLMTRDVDCPGKWVLFTAVNRVEAGEFFACAGKPSETKVSEHPWLIRVVESVAQTDELIAEDIPENILPDSVVEKMKDFLAFRYDHLLATQAPSKQTATQLKGRVKDQEVAEHTKEAVNVSRKWREPFFISKSSHGREYGNAIHAVMQYIRYDVCTDTEHVENEISRLAEQGFISQEQRKLVNSHKIANFFLSEIGMKLRSSKNVLREFKFSVLDDGDRFSPGMQGEKVLLQGVIDCALIEHDGISVIDFKTDHVTNETLPAAVEKYRPQVEAYAQAISRIYRMPIKSRLFYFFHMDQFVELK